MTRKQLPYFVAFLVLMFGAMACACLGSGTGIGGFQATANAAFTQAAAGAATAGALAGTAGASGNSAVATANAAATQANATAGANGGATQPEATAAATAGGTGGTASGGPSDIPLVSGQNNVLFATDQLVTYQTKTDIAAVATFYKDAMPKNGWTADTTSSVETATAAVLTYKKDTRTASVTIGKDPSSGQTLVAIAVQ